jgi:hypothetical protein
MQNWSELIPVTVQIYRKACVITSTKSKVSNRLIIYLQGLMVGESMNENATKIMFVFS